MWDYILNQLLVINDEGKILYKMHGISDAAWNVDKADCLSVTGYIIYFMGAPIA